MRTSILLASILLAAGTARAGDATPSPDAEPRPLLELTKRGYLGVELVEITADLASHFGLGGRMGVLVGRVEAGGPADQAGMRVGDVIASAGGKDVGDTFALSRVVREKHEGDHLAIEVYRDGAPLTLDVTIKERERKIIELGALGTHWNGLALDALDEDALRAKIEASVDPKAIEAAVGRATAFLDSPEWHTKLRRMHSLESDVEDRMKELEKRLKELEDRLEKEAGSK